MTAAVALCTYNGAAHLPALLDSLKRQTRLPDELVVCDDRSTDTTLSVIEAFARSAPFPVRVHVNPTNLGCTANFDRCLGLCTADILFPCDQDDVWHPDKIERMAAAFAPGVGLVAADCELVDANGVRLGGRQWANLSFVPPADGRLRVEDLLRFNVVTGAAAAVRADLLPLIRPIPAVWVHDGWMGLLAAAVSEVRLLPDPVIDYRQHAGQQIGSVRLTIGEQIRRARRMDAAYFARTAACFEAAAARLETKADVTAIRRKAAFTRAQQRMREGWRIARLMPAVGRLVVGDYGRFGRGWKGFAADLVL